MRQVSHPLPAGTPVCQPGHRPQLVQTLGAPAGHRLGTTSEPQWHVECFQCGISTVPTTRQSIALLHWRGQPDLFHIPLSQLANVRSRVAGAMAHAN